MAMKKVSGFILNFTDEEFGGIRNFFVVFILMNWIFQFFINIKIGESLASAFGHSFFYALPLILTFAVVYVYIKKFIRND
ncbi:hypothetical protein [Lysinibacillus sphaericus]|uniref:Uncharacterized protein n=2 Tax=Lysinibacillus sphaericus TaxID=1421 RepID=B1I0P1_LYSSC|nr:hypothetical protein [Lysinibacillus sphaericus]MBE5085776.1 hypothetical protein [Bacillus thuringiensis]ACA42400.1 hypothetical protein Bsph_p172 [Lysinibacillus sphaericus C3-41]AMO35357.1 hypothetical protein AR327_22980 [Lysinibacillus sphaericus]AMR93040.1 hypothetical protein A1T07_22805 [Lysinibacillus sphaericus]MBG9710616.1 hypothetical protein [Lysinibacillus sphaericus]